MMFAQLANLDLGLWCNQSDWHPQPSATRQHCRCTCAWQAYHTTHGGEVEQRKARYTDMVNKYYDLATSFYEYGKQCGTVGMMACSNCPRSLPTSSALCLVSTL